MTEANKSLISCSSVLSGPLGLHLQASSMHSNLACSNKLLAGPQSLIPVYCISPGPNLGIVSVEPAAGSNPWLRLSETIWAGGHPPGRYPLLSRTLVSSPTQLNYSHFSWEGAHVQKSKIPLADLAKVCVDATMHRAGHPERYIENVQYRNVAACL